MKTRKYRLVLMENDLKYYNQFQVFLIRIADFQSLIDQMMISIYTISPTSSGSFCIICIIIRQVSGLLKNNIFFSSWLFNEIYMVVIIWLF